MKLKNIQNKTLEELLELSENEIQNRIIDYCRENNILAIVVPNELARNNRSVKIEPGCSDLIIVLDSETIFVEVKTKTGKQRESQIKFQKKIEARNKKYFIARNLEELINILYICKK